MNGIELLLLRCFYRKEDHPQGWDRFVYDEENIHYAVLHILLQESPKFAAAFLQASKPITRASITLKPNGGLFDLLVEAGEERYYMELKIWADLKKDQFTRQTEFLKTHGGFGRYVLFTKASDAWHSNNIENDSGGVSAKVSLQDVLSACEEVEPKLAPEVMEVCNAYKKVLGHLQKRWSIP